MSRSSVVDHPLGDRLLVPDAFPTLAWRESPPLLVWTFSGILHLRAFCSPSTRLEHKSKSFACARRRQQPPQPPSPPARAQSQSIPLPPGLFQDYSHLALCHHIAQSLNSSRPSKRSKPCLRPYLLGTFSTTIPDSYQLKTPNPIRAHSTTPTLIEPPKT
jgi:hypothetical protein